MKQQIGLREANQHLARYIEAVQRGDEIVITSLNFHGPSLG
jgi:prevent-host-death family protein